MTERDVRVEVLGEAGWEQQQTPSGPLLVTAASAANVVQAIADHQRSPARARTAAGDVLAERSPVTQAYRVCPRGCRPLRAGQAPAR